MPINQKKSIQNSINRVPVKKQNNDKNKSSSNGQKLVSNLKIQSISSPNDATSYFSEDSHKIRLFNELLTRKNPFADLVRISLLLNPREFELPEDYVPDIQFPGSSKKPIINTTTREARHSSYSVKRAQELDRNNLPLILRTCYFCRKGCRKAPLIHCDYCPLVYHADCIDPPLTILPNTRWMCPNHVEPIAEEKLLSSSSFCERVKLWNHFSKPIDHESIKISFLDKVHGSSKQEPLGSSEFIKLGCRVPKRVKKEYDKFIMSIEKYDGKSEDESEKEPITIGDISENQTSEKEPSTEEITPPNNINQRHQQHESLIDIALRYMIESSKLLESKEFHHSRNGDNASLI